MRGIQRVLEAKAIDMGGIPVLQPLPSGGIDHLDPFLLVHHAQWPVAKGTIAKRSGVGPHPHRGFSPVSIIFEGEVHHRDSRGNSEVIGSGGVQWLQAGMGIIHSERPSEAIAKTGGKQELIQLWVNTPAKNKMDPPQYFSQTKSATARIPVEKGEGELLLVAGEQSGKKGNIPTQSPILAIHGVLEAGAEHTFTVSKHYNTFIYILEGLVEVNDIQDFNNKKLLIFKNDAENINLKVKSKLKFLLMAGEPLNEKIEQYGPFVMNNQTEVMQAIRDYQMGKMGVLIEE